MNGFVTAVRSASKDEQDRDELDTSLEGLEPTREERVNRGGNWGDIAKRSFAISGAIHLILSEWLLLTTNSSPVQSSTLRLKVTLTGEMGWGMGVERGSVCVCVGGRGGGGGLS